MDDPSVLCASFYFHVYVSRMRIIIYAPPYTSNGGGTVALYYLASLIREAGWESRICIMAPHHERNPNEFCTDYVNGLQSPDDAVVVYPELTTGNPLGASRAVRWILAAPGVAGPSQIHTWSPNDIIIRWDTTETASCVNIFRLSPSMTGRIGRVCENRRSFPTDIYRCCFLIRKGHAVHGTIPTNFHPPNAVNVDAQMCDLNTGLDILEHMDVLFTYDPYCAWIIYALMCGCSVVVCPLPGISRDDYIGRTMLRGGSLSGLVYDHNPIPLLSQARQDLLQNLSSVQNSWIDYITSLRITSIDRFMRMIETWDPAHTLRNASPALLA